MNRRVRRVENHTVRWLPEVWDRMAKLAQKSNVPIAEIANSAAWAFKRNELENIAEKKRELARHMFALEQKMKTLEDWEKSAIEAKEKRDIQFYSEPGIPRISAEAQQKVFETETDITLQATKATDEALNQTTGPNDSNKALTDAMPCGKDDKVDNSV